MHKLVTATSAMSVGTEDRAENEQVYLRKTLCSCPDPTMINEEDRDGYEQWRIRERSGGNRVEGRGG